MRNLLIPALFLLLSMGLCQAQTDIATTRILGISLGADLSSVIQKDLGDWNGIIGGPGNRQQASLRTAGPVSSGPYDALLTPPKGFKYLGVPLKSLGLYFFPDNKGTLRVFCLTFELDISESSYSELSGLLERQFGPMTFPDGWSDSGIAILLLPPEVALIDVVTQRKAEFWMRRSAASNN